MKNTILLFAFCLCAILTTDLNAQTKKELRAERKEMREAKIDSLAALPINSYVSIDLLPAFVGAFQRINVGYTQKINDRWFAGASVGYGFYSLYSDSEDYSLIEVRPEILYHFKRKKKHQFFAGLELFYIENSETRINDDFSPEDTQGGTVLSVLFDEATFDRTKYGATLNFGDYINFSKRLALRTTIGAGLRIRETAHSNLVNPVVQDFREEYSVFPSVYTDDGKSTGFQLNLNFKLIYKLY